MIDSSQFETKKAAYYTLGCKLNFAETSAIGKYLQDQGVLRVRRGEKADVCIVNTCSVTELANKKCRSAIRRIKKQHPNAYIIVTGCYAQLNPDDVSKIEGVDLVLGAEQKGNLENYLTFLHQDQSNEVQILSGKSNQIREFSPACSSDDRTRHFLKVHDGCDYYCTYCTIPAARGRSRNGSIASLVEQAKEVARLGGLEIVLTGVNIGDFGRSTGETFLDLIKALDQVEGIARYRISSIEPNLLSDEIIDFCASSKRFAPHFHIPLQSGSDAVLKLMHRRYDTALFRERVEHIKRVMPNCFIGIDVIVGTRGETPEYFEECYEFLKSLPFSALHVFSYSERPGTAALKIPYIVDPREKHRRSERLLSLSESKLEHFMSSATDISHKVLWENASTHDGLMEGYTENYLRCAAPYRKEALGNIELFTPTSFDSEHMLLVDDSARMILSK